MISPRRKPGQLRTPLKAMRANCYDCCGGSVAEIALCPITTCHFWPYRFGSRKRAKVIVAEEIVLAPQPIDDWWAERVPSYRTQKYYETDRRERQGRQNAQKSVATPSYGHFGDHRRRKGV